MGHLEGELLIQSLGYGSTGLGNCVRGHLVGCLDHCLRASFKGKFVRMTVGPVKGCGVFRILHSILGGEIPDLVV